MGAYSEMRRVMYKKKIALLIAVMVAGAVSQAHSQQQVQATKKNASGATAASSKQPIEIASDALEVLQNEKKAIFTGKVIATQGAITMRSDVMTVFYREAPEGQASAPASGVGNAKSDAMGKGIYRIESAGKVVFTSPTETAQGDNAVYMVDDQTATITGNVFLTRDKNVLKGTHLVYNMGTGRSVLTGGVNSGGTSTRVRGLFVPTGEK
jgi:lipopolysaccharide export system protein LptA